MFFGFFLLLATCPLSLSQIVPSVEYYPPDSSLGYSNQTGADVSKKQWSNLLGNLLYFYDAQRSGHLPPNNRVPWRNDSALGDGDRGNSLAGGYYDAGDYTKATYPLSFTLFSICWGASLYGKAYDNSNQTAYLDQTLRWGLDWLMMANPNPNTLYVQVGSLDRDYWGGDQNIPKDRPALQVNQTHIGTDVVALTSSAFSACSLLYSGFAMAPNTSTPASLTNGTYADQLRSHGVQLYQLAQQEPFQPYVDSIKEAEWAYPGNSYQGDLVVSDIMVALATASSNSSSTGKSPQQHLDNAVSLYNRFQLQANNQDVVYNWASRTPVIPILLAQIASLQNARFSPSGGLSYWQSESELYFDRILGGSGNGQLTRGGLLWYEGDSDLASLNPALNAALLMLAYIPMVTSADKGTKYQDYARGQLNYALGKNPMNVPYVVGSNPNSPGHPHDARSSGGSNISAIDSDPVESLYVIYGAVVGGPDRNDRFWDIRSDWPQTEIALDYNAPLVTLAAYSYLFDTKAPFFTSLAPGAYEAVRPSGTPCDPAFPCNAELALNKGQKIALAVGITVPGVVIFGLFIRLLIVWSRSKAAR